MSKLAEIKNDYLVARKSDDTITKNLLSTFIGEVELSLKGENPKSENVVIEATAKAFIKNAGKMNTADSKQEITILEKYLPKQASKDEVTEFLQDKDLTLGGRLIGLAKQHFNGNVDPQIVKEVIAELS